MLDMRLQSVSPHDLRNTQATYLGLEFGEDNSLDWMRQNEIREPGSVGAINPGTDLVTLRVEYLPAVRDGNLLHDALPHRL